MDAVDDDFKERLISEVQQYELIYDKKNPEHMNRNSISAAWRNLAEELNAKG